MKRALLLVIGLVVLVAIAAWVAVSVLHVGSDTPAPADPGDAPAVVAPDDDTQPLEATQISDQELRRRRLSRPWPFKDFSMDIAIARKPTRRTVRMERADIETKMSVTLSEVRFSLDIRDATIEDIVNAVAPHFSGTGLRIYTQDPPVSTVFEHVKVTDCLVQELVFILAERSSDQVAYAITPLGFCIGSKPACYQARIDALEWERERGAEVALEAADDSFLDEEYEPDFRGAHIGEVIAKIKEDTGVEVIADEATWSLPVELSWKTEPLPLRVALRGIAQQMGAALHAHDGRAYLLSQ